jgi:hypothetical protein
MMRVPLKLFACATLALLFSVCASQAATIVKLDLGGVGPDLTFSGGAGGLLSTIDDNPAGLTGDQATNVLFTSFLSGLGSTTGSYSLAGATAVGAPTPLGGGVLMQNFVGGNFQIYDSFNTLLLDVNLSSSLLVGGGNGAFFNINNGVVVGGLPAITSQLVGNSIGMSMTLTNINTTPAGPPGLSVGLGGFLNSFVGDATKEITGTQVPEPTAFVLAFGSFALPLLLRRRG